MSIISLLLLVAIPVLIVVLVIQSKRNNQSDLPLSDKFSTLAIVAFVLAFFVSLAAVVLGHIALSQMKRTRERGWGLAIAALILGYFGLVAGIIVGSIGLSQLN